MRSRIPKHQLDLLASVPLFAGCTQNELRDIAQLGTPISVVADVELIRAGKPGSEFFLVVDGQASCRIHKKEIKRFSAGSYFGEMALLSGGLRSADVVTLTPMDLVVFDSREFRSLLMSSPKICLKMLSTLAERLIAADLQPSF